MPTFTSIFGLSKPLVNNATDQDLWGGELNADMDELDVLLETAMNFASSLQTTSFSASAPTSGTSNTGNAKQLFRCNATGGNIVMSLPAASTTGNGFTIAVKKIDSSANTVTITANGGDTIDGASTFTLVVQYSWAIIVSDGVSVWSIISDFASTAGLPTLSGNNVFTGTNDFTANTLTAQTQASADTTTKVATTAFVNPNSTVAVAGSRTYPDGSIDKWGFSSSGSGTITFPVAFPNSCFGVQVTNVNTATGNGPSVNTVTASTFKVVLTPGGTSFYWRAIGH